MIPISDFTKKALEEAKLNRIHMTTLIWLESITEAKKDLV